jgi:molybdate transport system ATP-binding protein
LKFRQSDSGRWVFSLHDAVVSRNGTQLVEPFNWKVHHGESWWICGANGSGKSTLLEVLIGQQRLTRGEMIFPDDLSIERFSASVALIRRDFTLYHMFSRTAGFYQQRYFSLGIEETPLVMDFVARETGIAEETICAGAKDFGIEVLLYKHMVSLSTGEGRRILLLMLWLTEKSIIFFDDPYAGLDPEGRQLVNHTLEALHKKKVTLLITGVETAQPPDFIDHVFYIRDRHVAYTGNAGNFRYRKPDSTEQEQKLSIRPRLTGDYDYSFSVAAEMKDITIQYDDRIVQSNFSWKIRKGDKWMLTGPNGSGKSTLMSLIYGDNPMAYAYELVVFDRVRGSGETIWDIKRPMGFFSSELQQFFPRSMTVQEAILTGFSDHLVVRDDLTHEHLQQADELIGAAGLTKFRETPLLRLSFSQCRLALVCRALVKFPPVVLLDEPCQGLDSMTTERVNSLVDAVCHDERKTLIYATHQLEAIPKIINLHLDLKKQSMMQV